MIEVGEKRRWEVTVKTTGVNQAFNIVLTGTTIKIVVDWGDGTQGIFTTAGTKTRTYASAGTYIVKILGKLTGTGSVIFYTASGNTSHRIQSTTAITSVRGITSVTNMFRSATALISLPENLFKNCTIGVGSAFFSTFYGCTGLTSLPADLFTYCTGISTSAFSQTFSGCTGLTSLPADLFKYNTGISTSAFSQTFRGCTGLTSLPADLFTYCTGISTSAFSSTFYGCTGLTSLPADLFTYCTVAQTFSMTFRGCTGLTAIPATLFDAQKATATTFTSCFQTCTNLDGNAPELWNAALWTVPPSAYALCFNGCTGLDNYADIPAGWK